MKKIVTVILTLMMGLSLLTGCGSDPVAEDFEKFLNTDMVDVNANYEDLKAEMEKWDSFKEDSELSESIKKVVIPNIDESLDMLSKIKPETDEVKSLKSKYKKVLDTYKEGFELMLAALESGEEADAEKGSEKVDEGLKALEEYNAALESLAEEKDMNIEY